MAEQLRQQPGANGMITANGWYMTKQAIGIYSTRPAHQNWQRGDDAPLQQQIDSQDHPRIDDAPEGPGVVDSFTVVCDGDGPQQGIIVGSLDNGRRFIAHTEKDDALLAQMMHEDMIGRRGVVSTGEEHNLFSFD